MKVTFVWYFYINVHVPLIRIQFDDYADRFGWIWWISGWVHMSAVLQQGFGRFMLPETSVHCVKLFIYSMQCRIDTMRCNCLSAVCSCLCSYVLTGVFWLYYECLYIIYSLYLAYRIEAASFVSTLAFPALALSSTSASQLLCHIYLALSSFILFLHPNGGRIGCFAQIQSELFAVWRVATIDAITFFICKPFFRSLPIEPSTVVFSRNS